MAVDRARAIVGRKRLIGLSTHSTKQIDAAEESTTSVSDRSGQPPPSRAYAPSGSSWCATPRRTPAFRSSRSAASTPPTQLRFSTPERSGSPSSGRSAGRRPREAAAALLEAASVVSASRRKTRPAVQPHRSLLRSPVRSELRNEAARAHSSRSAPGEAAARLRVAIGVAAALALWQCDRLLRRATIGGNTRERCARIHRAPGRWPIGMRSALLGG